MANLSIFFIWNSVHLRNVSVQSSSASFLQNSKILDNEYFFKKINKLGKEHLDFVKKMIFT